MYGPISATAASVTMTPASYAGHNYYSSQAYAQTQVHSLFLYPYNPMGQQSVKTGERSGAGHTFLRAFRNTEAVTFISKTHTTFLKTVRAVGIELKTSDSAVLQSYHKAITASVNEYINYEYIAAMPAFNVRLL
ncbi:unnamed protein product [Chrysodeixis includens]|uniref:Uncharacterized protein n=1 Tax=Chrysodeixis includens TaxID=689277 RepID=A0A9N8KYQ6_CHRIL|nr:unnamed protein product [Chrysodeixis includens]